MSQYVSVSAVNAGRWVEQAVYGLDRWLRQHQGVYEYSTDPLCMFRVQRGQADCDLRLSDGTYLREGDPVLNLHLWNEHVPAIAPSGLGIVWAREMARRVEVSMIALAHHLKCARGLEDIAAVRGDMRLGTTEQNAQLTRLAARYGFEPATVADENLGLGAVKRYAENIFICMLVLASNPPALRWPVLRRGRKLVYLSRAALERRYASAARLRMGAEGGRIC